MLRLLLVFLFAACLLPAWAQDAPAASPPSALGGVHDDALFQAETSVSSQGDAERRGGVNRALVQVLVRLTGDRAAPLSPVIRKALANAEGLVLASDYRDDTESPAVNGTARQILRIQFDPSAVEALIAAAGLNYWPPKRPRPLLWLVIDDGRGPRLVNDQQLAVVRPLAQRGLERGLRFGLPSGTAAEQAAVARMWAQDVDAVAQLTRRYNTDAQLLGKLHRVAGGWRSEWLLTQAGSEVGRWELTELDPQRAIAEGADGAADALARRDAVAIDAGPAGARMILISGLGSADDFVRVMGYLQNLAVVRDLQVVRTEADQMQVRLDLAVGARGFDALLASGKTLTASGKNAEGVAMYRLQP